MLIGRRRTTNKTHDHAGRFKTDSGRRSQLHTRPLNARLYPQRLKYALNGVSQVDLQYAFDPNGNVQAITDLRPNGNDSQSFGYDDLDRLTSAIAANSYGTAAFEYDAFDNLRRHQLATRDLRYQYADGTGRLTAITLPNNSPVLSYSYDTRGNATFGGPTQIDFDRADTVVRVVGQESYRYDAHGHRIESVVGT